MSAMRLSEVAEIARRRGPCSECGGLKFVALPASMVRAFELKFCELVESLLDLDHGELIEGYACCERCGHPRVVTSFRP